MKTIYLASLIILNINLHAQLIQKNFIDQNYIEVSGVAETSYYPEIMTLKIVQKTSSYKKNISLKNLKSKLFLKLHEAGIDTIRDCEFLGYNSGFRFTPQQNLIPYIQEFILTIRDFQSFNAIMNDFKEMGIYRMYLIKYELGDIEKKNSEVFEKALQDAYEKSLKLTAINKHTIGKVLYVQEKPDVSDTIKWYVEFSSPQLLNLSYYSKLQINMMKIRKSIIVKYAIE
ncbi:MAG: SIMPL domain-containing protein [Saprospiraceae bacterium]|nr:SIMPL domain-containing protein [Saprospiraceae bacterium]